MGGSSTSTSTTDRTRTLKVEQLRPVDHLAARAHGGEQGRDEDAEGERPPVRQLHADVPEEQPTEKPVEEIIAEAVDKQMAEREKQHRSEVVGRDRKIDALTQLGVSVIHRVPLETPIHADNAGYLWTKANRMDHLLSIDGVYKKSTAMKSNGHGKAGHD